MSNDENAPIPSEEDDNAPRREAAAKVDEARQRDVGRSIIRLDNKMMSSLNIRTGDIVEIEGKKVSAAIAWPAYPQDQNLGIIRIDSRLRRNIGVELGESVIVRKAHEKVAKSIVLSPSSIKIRTDSRFESFVKRKLLNYPVAVEDEIYISIGISREICFKVISIRPKGICIVKQSTVLHINESPTEEAETGIPFITYEDIGGLDDEIQKVREMVELPLRHPELFQRLGIDPPKGVLLRGPPGCGKTLLAKAVANESEAHFIAINGPEIMSKFYGESEKRLRQYFVEAEEHAPSIIFIDEIDAIAPKREDVTGEVERRVVAQMLALMDGLKARGKVIIIGATNRPNAVDPALRRPGRFDREIEIKVPTQKGRLEIFQIHTRRMPFAKEVQLDGLAAKTHGFVGADIAAMCREAGMAAMRRYLPQIDLDAETIPQEFLDTMEITPADFEEAQKEVLPSGIREVFIEIPSVHWSEVGGLDYVKQQLIEAVEWPLKNPEAYKRMGISPPKGVLLYGPPGCGKTLLARAVATESEANFISIKGPELLSKWVGESERAIREIFRKAKLAAPCIIFFDEIDAMAPQRGMGATDSGVSERVISQLLTELDGLTQTKDLVIIAATNRPDILDPALIRPGRIDRLTFVSPPTDDDREKIFKIFTEGMPLDTSIKTNELAAMTKGFTGADIETVCREAGIRALRENINANKITRKHFDNAMKDIHPSASQEVVDWYAKFEEKLKLRKPGRTSEGPSGLFM